MALVDDNGTAAQYRSLDKAVNSSSLHRSATESDEGKNLKILRELAENEPNFTRGSGGRHDKVFPLSRLLVSALISERMGNDRQIDSDETYADRDSDSPLPPSSHSEIDYDRRDAEGESDVDNGGYSECSPISGDQGNRLWGDDQGWLLL